MIKEYILLNWALLLVLAAFVISLKVTVFRDSKTIRRMYVLIVTVFLLSIVVFAEFYLADAGEKANVRIVLMAVRYSTTPFILAQIIYTLTKELRWYIFIPAMGLAVINAFLSGLILPFVYGQAYSQIFCTTIAIALYVYYVFSILQLTKKGFPYGTSEPAGLLC